MFRFLPYLLKGLWRHRGRTLLTVSGAAVAMFLFCFVGAVQQGLERLTGSREAERTLIVFQENRFCPATSKLPESYAAAIARLPGVVDVVPIKVFTNNCRASLDVAVFNGMPPDKLRTARNLSLVSGDWSEFEKRTDGAMVGRTLADRRGLSPGQKFTIGGVSVTVAGVFTSDLPAEESFVYTHLDFLQRAQGKNQSGTVTLLEVRLADGAKPDDVAAEIDAMNRRGAVATSTRPKGLFQRETLSDFAELIGMAHWLGYACVGLVLTLVATTTVMAVQDRIQEHAVLQTIGLRPLHVFRLVLVESALQSIAGGSLGIAVAMAALWLGHFAIGAEGVTIAFRPAWSTTLSAFGVALGIGILAGILPGWHAARASIVASLRQA